VELQWRVADADVRSLVWGFVERRDAVRTGAAVHFPMAYPHMQVSLEGRYRVELEGRFGTLPRGALWGSSFEGRRGEPAGKVRAFVAAFTFEGAALLLGGPPRIAAGRILDLDSLPSCASAGLIERLILASSFETRVRIVENFFRTLAAGPLPRFADSPVLALSSAIATDGCRGPVGEIARVAGLSERTLYNRLQLEIGCGPKRLLRVARLHRLLRTLHPCPLGGRPTVDPLLEFVDQAHMHREFVALTGVKPRAFVSGKSSSGDRLFHSLGAESPEREPQSLLVVAKAAPLPQERR
jgi:AraC-like DNA-binding protein